jgi:hypothetical protein
MLAEIRTRDDEVNLNDRALGDWWQCIEYKAREPDDRAIGDRLVHIVAQIEKSRQSIDERRVQAQATGDRNTV